MTQPQPIRARRNEKWRLPSNLGAGLAVLALVLGLPAGGCGANVDGGTLRGSETHFLTRCDAACSDGLDCIGGICTRTCLLASGSCGDLASGAVCTDQSVEPGQAAVCDLGCSETADCAELGASHVCDAGYCRSGAPVSQPVTDPIAEVPEEVESSQWVCDPNGVDDFPPGTARIDGCPGDAPEAAAAAWVQYCTTNPSHERCPEWCGDAGACGDAAE